MQYPSIETLYEITIKKGLSVTTDSRSIPPQSAYFALKGEKFNGNHYAAESLQKGAHVAIIDDVALYKKQEIHKGRYIIVVNVLQTLQALAAYHRKQCTIPIIAIGGSNGKTTTKELVTTVLATRYNVLSTTGNLNNDIGVPLTLLRLSPEHTIAVIEIGANHPHEHTMLMNMVHPTHVLVTNNGADHLEGFGSLEGARKANKEIYDWMYAQQKIDQNLQQHLTRTIFANKNIADIYEDSLTPLSNNTSLSSQNTEHTTITHISYPQAEYASASRQTAALYYDRQLFSSQLFGSFNEANILAAITIGEYFSVPQTVIQQAIASYIPTSQRSQIMKKDDHTLILDCYNANPTSMTAALIDVCTLPYDTYPNGKIIIVGGMKELGTQSAQEHKAMLDFLIQHTTNKDTVLLVGKEFYEYRTEPAYAAYTFFENSLTARPFFQSLPLTGTLVFLKASRGTALEQIL